MKQKKPKVAKEPREVSKKKEANPVAVRPYFKGGKKVKGYNRRKAGDGVTEEK